MVIDNEPLVEYPFKGSFYKIGIDYTKPPSQQVEEEILVLETDCDIQEAQKSDTSGNVVSTFNVYFPFDKNGEVGIQKGMIFRGSLYGVDVEGEIIGLFPTQMGGCAVYLKDRKS